MNRPRRSTATAADSKAMGKCTTIGWMLGAQSGVSDMASRAADVAGASYSIPLLMGQRAARRGRCERVAWGVRVPASEGRVGVQGTHFS